MTKLLWVTASGFMLEAIDQDRLTVVAIVYDLRDQDKPRIVLCGSGLEPAYRDPKDDVTSYESLPAAMAEIERRHEAAHRGVAA